MIEVAYRMLDGSQMAYGICPISMARERCTGNEDMNISDNGQNSTLSSHGVLECWSVGVVEF